MFLDDGVQMWFLANGQLHSVHLRVPRTLYVDSEQPLDMESVTAIAMGAAAAGGVAGAVAGLVATPGGGLQPGSQLAGVLAGLRGAACVPAAGKHLPGGRTPCHLYEASRQQLENESNNLIS